MQESEEETDINFLRAKHLLDTRIEHPGFLIAFWRLLPECHFPHPSVEDIPK